VGVWRLLPTGTRWAQPAATGRQMSTPRGDSQFADARTKPYVPRRKGHVRTVAFMIFRCSRWVAEGGRELPRNDPRWHPIYGDLAARMDASSAGAMPMAMSAGGSKCGGKGHNEGLVPASAEMMVELGSASAACPPCPSAMRTRRSCCRRANP
jgi:hypothetical protein